jgi:transcriptional repressor NrdR
MTEGGEAIRRRRMCTDCDRRFTTKERAEVEIRVSVTKCDGSRVPYVREKVLVGVERACYKLPISDEAIQRVVDRVEGDIIQNNDRGVTSEQIGAYVGRALRALNQVAYVRFMSVHRKFAGVEEFVEVIRDVREHVAREIPSQQTLFNETKARAGSGV